MGKGRFLYNNLITDDAVITPSSWRSGLITSALKDGTGSAVLQASGTFVGLSDVEYIVEIDSVVSGAEVGQATFKWSDGSGSWNATGVATSGTAITLNNGVSMRWTSGTGADFVVGDKWYFKGVNPFPAAALIDMNRDRRLRSAGLDSPNAIVVDLGSAQTVQALIIMDHNISSGAVITLMGNSSNSWGSPAFSESVTWVDKKILHYLSTSQTYRYWRLAIDDDLNGDGYIEIGELYLGPYLEPSKNFDNGYSRDAGALTNSNSTPYGITRYRFLNMERPFKYKYSGLSLADLTLMEAMFSTLGNMATGLLKPVWFNEDSDYPGNVWLVVILGMPHKHSRLTYFDVDLTMPEVLSSV